MAKIVTFGELMLRLQPYNYERFVQCDHVEFTFGGGEANVAVSLANYGMDVAFVTKLPSKILPTPWGKPCCWGYTVLRRMWADVFVFAGIRLYLERFRSGKQGVEHVQMGLLGVAVSQAVEAPGSAEENQRRQSQGQNGQKVFFHFAAPPLLVPKRRMGV